VRNTTTTRSATETRATAGICSTSAHAGPATTAEVCATTHAGPAAAPEVPSNATTADVCTTTAAACPAATTATTFPSSVSSGRQRACKHNDGEADSEFRHDFLRRPVPLELLARTVEWE
jgi:hypothetical protein